MAHPPPPPPEEQPLPPAAEGPPGGVPADLEAGACPRCGATYSPGQEYCLECGLRIPVVRGFLPARVVPGLSRAWQRRIPWYPGDWIWPVLLSLVVATAGTAVAIVASRDENPTSQTITATDTGTTEGPTTTIDTTTATVTTSTTTETEPPPPTGPIAWPKGTTGYSVFLASVAKSDGLASARTIAKKALDAGLTDVGILDSSNFSNLRAGYYVPFSGVFDTLAEAESHLQTVRSTFAGATPRKVVP